MKKTTKRFVAAGRILYPAMACLIILSLGLAVPYAGNAQGTRSEARLMATAAPTSQTQNVNVVNTPTVLSQQGGSWSVGLTGSPSVTVGNSTANPIPVVSSPGTPFQSEMIISFADGSLGGNAGFDIPTGLRLVIEHVSASAALTPGQQLYQTRFDIVQGGSISGHYFVASFQGSRSGIADYYAISQETHLYAVGTLVVNAFRTDSLGPAQMNVSVSGYLVSQ